MQHVCMYSSMQECKYASMHVCKYASIQVCNYASMQVCSIQVCNMQICKYLRMQVLKPIYGLPKVETKGKLKCALLNQTEDSKKKLASK